MKQLWRVSAVALAALMVVGAVPALGHDPVMESGVPGSDDYVAAIEPHSHKVGAPWHEPAAVPVNVRVEGALVNVRRVIRPLPTDPWSVSSSMVCPDYNTYTIKNNEVVEGSEERNYYTAHSVLVDGVYMVRCLKTTPPGSGSGIVELRRSGIAGDDQRPFFCSPGVRNRRGSSSSDCEVMVEPRIWRDATVIRTISGFIFRLQ